MWSFTFSLHQKCGMEIVDQRKRISFFLLYLWTCLDDSLFHTLWLIVSSTNFRIASTVADRRPLYIKIYVISQLKTFILAVQFKFDLTWCSWKGLKGNFICRHDTCHVTTSSRNELPDSPSLTPWPPLPVQWGGESE